MNQAPSQSPNVEYDVIGDEPTVYCEDKKKHLPESDCTKVGEFWYSNNFLSMINEAAENAQEDLEILSDLIDDFRIGKGFEMNRINTEAYCIMHHIRVIRDGFQMIDIAPKGKK